MGGRYDSSKTRVRPVLTGAAAKGTDWLRRLLRLAKGGATQGAELERLDLRVDATWSPATETALQAPRSLLAWLVGNLSVKPGDTDRSATAEKRRALHRGDPDMVAEALRLLSDGRAPRHWHVLEGQTYPDAFIVTPDTVVVIEGKRTEAGPTTKTTWMPVRHQMLRHMDAAWDNRDGRRVLGMFIVEALAGGIDVPPVWLEAAKGTMAASAVEDSLPHRSPDERKEIVSGFVGVTTWQAVCAEFGLGEEYLPDTTDDVQPRRGGS